MAITLRNIGLIGVESGVAFNVLTTGLFRIHSQVTSQIPGSLSYFFPPLSARGPTRRRNSTGLAELWGGWPIEQVFPQKRIICVAVLDTSHISVHLAPNLRLMS